MVDSLEPEAFSSIPGALLHRDMQNSGTQGLLNSRNVQCRIHELRDFGIPSLRVDNASC